MIVPGTLRTRVALQARGATRDADGGQAIAYTTCATLWGNVSTQGGQLFFGQQKLNAKVSHQVQIRYRRGVLPMMRFVFGDTVLLIHAAIDPDQRRRELLCFCEQVIE